MMPGYLFLLTEILKEMNMETNYLNLERVYENLSHETKALYFNDEKEEYKNAARLEIKNNFIPRNIAKDLTKDINEYIVDAITYSGRTLEDISKSTAIPLSVIRTMVKEGEGSFTNYMTLLNYLGKGLNIVSWEELFKNNRNRGKGTPIKISEIDIEIYTKLGTGLNLQVLPPISSVGANIIFEDVIVGDDVTTLIEGDLTQYDGTDFPGTIFDSGNKLLLAGSIDAETHKVLLNEYKLHPEKPVLYMGKRVITLSALLNSLFSYNAYDPRLHFIINIDYEVDKETMKIVEEKILIEFVMDDVIYRSTLDLSSIKVNPYTPVI